MHSIAGALPKKSIFKLCEHHEPYGFIALFAAYLSHEHLQVNLQTKWVA